MLLLLFAAIELGGEPSRARRPRLHRRLAVHRHCPVSYLNRVFWLLFTSQSNQPLGGVAPAIFCPVTQEVPFMHVIRHKSFCVISDVNLQYFRHLPFFQITTNFLEPTFLLPKSR